jgi:sugar O-acyltransferase (sialic acid O-acetyltransferase NeuD family)
MKNKSVIIGYSGHAYVLLDILLSQGKTAQGYCEKKQKLDNPYQIDFLGDENDPKVIERLVGNDVYLGVGNNKARAEIYGMLSVLNFKFPFISHQQAFISGTAQVSYATVIMPGSIINAKAQIGVGVICNSGSIIEHECIIEDFAHIAPGAVLSGNVKVGSHSFIGANSVIKQGVSIGSNVIIGAGSVIIRDIADNVKVVGNPQRQIS